MSNKLSIEPKVSVIVPMYNQEKCLVPCLRSICNQSYRNLEIIVVNDGSTDRSPEMAREWAARDKRIRILDKANGGTTLARRDGYALATGELVAFVDSDDLLPKQAISILVGHLVGKDVDMVMGSMTKKLGFVHKSHTDSHYTFPYHQVISQPELFDKYYVGFFRNNVLSVSMCGHLYRKSVIDKALSQTALYDDDIRHMGEDQFFNLKLFPFLGSAYRTDETVYIYRFGGVTTRFNPNFTQLFVSADKRLELLDQYQYSDGYEPLFAEYVACLYFHASQMIACAVTDKQGVIDYFRHEMEHRQVMTRLLEFYTLHGAPDQRAQLLLDHDFEGMYRYATAMVAQRRNTLKSRLRRWAIKLLMHFD